MAPIDFFDLKIGQEFCIYETTVGLYYPKTVFLRIKDMDRCGIIYRLCQIHQDKSVSWFVGPYKRGQWKCEVASDRNKSK